MFATRYILSYTFKMTLLQIESFQSSLKPVIFVCAYVVCEMAVLHTASTGRILIFGFRGHYREHSYCQFYSDELLVKLVTKRRNTHHGWAQIFLIYFNFLFAFSSQKYSVANV